MTPPMIPPPLPSLPGLAGRLNFDPLSPFAAALPLMLAVASLNTPLPALWTLTLTIPLLFLIQPRKGIPIALALLVFATVLSLSMAQATPISKVGASPVVFELWGAPIEHNQLFVGAKLGAKLAAVISLAALTGLLATPQDLLRSLVQHLRLPYRVPYAGIAALSFMSRFRDEHRAIREAHALRGSRLRTPLLTVPVRWVTSIPALTAAAVRHAERMSMSMDSRAFAAFPTRTEPRVLTWRWRDSVLLLAGWVATVAVAYFFGDAGVVLHDV
ncbi:energy-coupling factor transporter transmembrane component T [Schaalia sp. Marseille-Q2122]|uniref:energy-coupling factor transporter transmembrane component T n=1 Tax=Schaalia sp. Marseille-Q2122 TaxID=2736604 RepID=UPI00158AA4FB|nr:energy-coupling factor transporter transmembrane component T [Schaalia sp. Marseille-Q2122]